MKWNFYHVALATALVEGTGALLTLYWVKFNTVSCHFFTCQSPPLWLGTAMFISFGAGVAIPISGLISLVARRLQSSRAEVARYVSSIPSTPQAPFIQNMPKRFRLFAYQAIAFSFLIATGIGLYIVHWLYMQFYLDCFMVGPILLSLGVNCTNIFANVFFTQWTAATIALSAGAVIAGSLANLPVNVSRRRFFQVCVS